MKVFISWSGESSLKVAQTLRDWLPSVIQAIKPYVSSEDIDKGARWSTDISKELEESSYGILCVTNENFKAPWLNFEAGALSKSFDKSRVSPFLFGIKRAELSGPILQFQSTIYEEGDVKKLITGLNNSCEPQCIEDSKIENVFNVWWPELRKKLDKMLAELKKEGGTSEAAGSPRNKKEDILEEILELSRSQLRLLRSPEYMHPQRAVRGLSSKSEGDVERAKLAMQLAVEHAEDFRRQVASMEEAGVNSIPLIQVETFLNSFWAPLKHVGELVQVKYDFNRSSHILYRETEDQF